MHLLKRKTPRLSISLFSVWISKNVCIPLLYTLVWTDLLTPSGIIIIDVDARPDDQSTLYDLIANVTHESVAGTTRDKENTVWKVHLRTAGGGGDNEKWFMIQDLIVEETRKEMIFLGETILQVVSCLLSPFKRLIETF